MLSVVAAQPAIAQQQRIAELERRVAELERLVSQLQQRLAKLEKRDGENTGARSQAAATGDWKNRSNWRQLRRGMTEEDVRRLLGEAGKVDVNEYFFTWYYGYPGGGSVQFDTESRRVESWSEP